MNRLRAWCFVCVGLVCLNLVFVSSVRAADAEKPVSYMRDIQPILSDNCYFCHGPDTGKRKGDLRLDQLDPKLGPFVERDGYKIISPGKIDDSVLADRITSDDPDVKMPPPASHRELTSAQIQLLQKWIAQGAKWGKHWSLIAPVRPEVPAVKDASWVRNPIDSFVLAKLEKESLAVSPQADKPTLIRRVTLDLTGLPPTPAEVDAFVADNSSDAYEKVVDRLLASPRYGERQVWEWLDLARYADTNGYQGDATRTMWPWRDWAIKAINDNMPYDQFVIKQIAGDLLPNATTDDKLATGFLRNHMINGEGGRIPEENRVDYVLDQTETVSTAFLGLTVGCARCHDHKYDPITQKDYYSLSAFFNNTPVDGGIGGGGQVAPVLDVSTPENKQALIEASAQITERARDVKELEKTVFPRPATQPASASPKAAGLSGDITSALKEPPGKRSVHFLEETAGYFKGKDPKYAAAVTKLIEAMKARERAAEAVPKVMVMEESKPRETFVLVKGAYDKHADKVTARTPATLPALPDGEKHDRLALAKWLFEPEHPLTARVTVNRYWQQFFGIGIVKTEEDFGVQGERPVNQDLLDWLAVEYRESGWNVKALERLIVTSATYRQSSKVTPAMFERDSDNRLLARGPRFRLPSFVLRDQALFASGLMVEKLGGPPVKPYQPAGVWEDATFGQIKYEQDHGDALYRRSLYTFWRRIVGPTEFFDGASRQTCTVRTSRTNTPLQAFITLNDPTYVESARWLAQRVMTTAGTSPEKRIAMAFKAVLSREPSAEESKILVAGLDRLKKQYADDPTAAKKLLAVGESKRDESLDVSAHAAYTALCLEMFNFDEAVTKE